MQTNEKKWVVVGKRHDGEGITLYGDRVLGRFGTTSIPKYALTFETKSKAVKFLHREKERWQHFSQYNWAVRLKKDSSNA